MSVLPVAHHTTTRPATRPIQAPAGLLRLLAWALVLLAITAVLAEYPAPTYPRIGLAVVLALAGLRIGLEARGDRLTALFAALADEWTAHALKRLPAWQAYRTNDADATTGPAAWQVVTPAGTGILQPVFRDARGRRAQVARHRRDLAAVRNLAAGRVPVLVVWGPAKPALPSGYRIEDGVYVLDGDRPTTWPRAFAAAAGPAGQRSDAKMSSSR